MLEMNETYESDKGIHNLCYSTLKFHYFEFL